MTRASTSIALTLAIAAGGCGQRDAARPAERRALEVTTARASMGESAEPLEAGGVVAARTSALLTSRIVAPVLTVKVRAGDRVRAGDVLVTLDARDTADRARQAHAAVTSATQAVVHARAQQEAAEADHTLAVAWHSRITALHAKNAATAQERDEAAARLAAAAARATGARAGIEQAAANLEAARAAGDAAVTTESFTRMRAPFDGLVTERLTDPGNLASPVTPLLRVDSSGPKQVEVRVDEARVSYIRPDDRVDVVLERSTAGEAETILEGRVTEVARAVAADQRAFTVKIALPAGADVRSGTFARVRFRGAPRRALLVPASAVRRHGQVRSLFVVENGVARLRLVQIGEDGPDGLTVLAGLEAGELVVTSPPSQLGDGHPVVSGAPQRTGARP